MAIGFKALREIFDGRLREAHDAQSSPRAYAMARAAALREVFDMVGIESTQYGAPQIQLDDRGMPTLKGGCASPREFSLRHLGESIFGHERFAEIYDPGAGGFDFGVGRGIMEAAVGPETFVDINTFNLGIAGLVNAEIMQAFLHPQYVGRDLVKVVPTRMNGQKLIGISPVPPQSKAAKGRQPGESHVEVGVGSAYQTTPQTVEQALKIKITREAAFFDLTGEVLDMAKGVGDELAYGQEKDIADTVLGVTDSYNRNGTAYATYQTTTPYVNDQVNAFSDETDVDDARQLFVGMTDPETGREIRIDAKTILCMPQKEQLFREQLFGATVQLNSQFGALQYPSRQRQTTSALASLGASPGAYEVRALSAIWYNRATAADGLGYSAANAKGLWLLGEFQEAFFWMENWPLTLWQANADELMMKDHGLIAAYGANLRGVAYSKEPRRAVRNKAA